ncbi:unnamed protein product [Calicophoron daubneyi]|uniref:Uncharacterized protein n=1 Tax=Calicophoron daubneyi TaxID=300641 RepID=A0AAV2T516_CALDB
MTCNSGLLLMRLLENASRQNEVVWLDAAIEEMQIINQEFQVFVEKKLRMKQIYSTTISEYHEHSIESLRKEREKMIERFEGKKQALLEVLAKEQATLEKHNEALAGMNELKLVRDQQEAEIAHLEKEARKIRFELSEKLAALKEHIREENEKLRLDAKESLERTEREAVEESRRLVIEKAEEIHEKNNAMREAIRRCIEDTKALEKHRDALMVQNEKLRIKHLYAMDLGKLQNRRLAGFERLNSTNPS